MNEILPHNCPHCGCDLVGPVELSRMQLVILGLRELNLTAKEVAVVCGNSENTVVNTTKEILRRTSADSVRQAIQIVRMRGAKLNRHARQSGNLFKSMCGNS
jgi:DNA-binding CsgD family transcriptional regulator